MSSIPYPHAFDQNLEEERYEQRYALAVKMLDPGDVIAEVESLVAQILDPDQHPLAGLVAYYLEAGGPDTGRRPWHLEALAAAYDRLVQAALSQLIAEQLAEFGVWED
jgi:hypothetical protein